MSDASPGSSPFLSRLSPQYRGLAFVSMAALLWSSSGLFIKLLALTPFQIAGYRSLIAGLTIMAVLAARGERIAIKLTCLNLLCAGAYAATLILFVVATKLTRAANAIFLQFSAPIYLLFLEPLVLKTPFRYRDLFAIFACLGGGALFFLGEWGGGSLLGNLLGMASGISLAVFSLLLKQKSLIDREESPVLAIMLGNFAVFILCLPMIATATPAVTWKPGLLLLYLGVFQLGVAYMLFAKGIHYASATGAMITSMLEAVFNPIWVFLGVGEKPTGYGMLGAMVMLGVIAWYNLRAEHVTVARSA